MKKFVAAVALCSLAIAGALPAVSLAATAAAVPCENMLNDVKAALKDAKLSDADKTKVADLQGRASNAARPTTTPALMRSSPTPSR